MTQKHGSGHWDRVQADKAEQTKCWSKYQPFNVLCQFLAAPVTQTATDLFAAPMPQKCGRLRNRHDRLSDGARDRCRPAASAPNVLPGQAAATGSARGARSMTPPPSTCESRYRTRDCPGLIADTGSANASSRRSPDAEITVAAVAGDR